ncbi:MAG TPA: Imm7 family immunity protein [Chryseolinea sp.]|nr:Imm7 family immunity protein [Chryseolinea sp.]
MTEYHCWTCIRYDAHDTDLDLQAECVSVCERYLASHQYLTDGKYKIVKYNGMATFLASALHNHNDGYIIDIFNWLGQHAPGSYGLLYYQDNETKEMDDNFKVLVMKKGKVTEKADPFLSPRAPTIEDETDWSRD